MVYELKDAEKAAPLFEGWQESMIWSCLQKIMGKIYTDSPEHPASAMALLADFCFFAGKPDAELVRYWAGLHMPDSASDRTAQRMGSAEVPGDMPCAPPDVPDDSGTRGIIMVPRSRAWGERIESCYKDKAKKVTRFAIKKEPDTFDR